MTILVDYNKFIVMFPEFSTLSQEEVESSYSQIGAFISPQENTAVLNNVLRERAVYLATAVICKEWLGITNFNNNQQIGTIAGAGEGSDSVSMQSVPYKTMLEWDLTNANIQPYGKALLRILRLAQPQMAFNTNANVPYYNMIQGK